MSVEDSITILPLSYLPPGSQPTLMYLPVYVVPGAPNYYAAGPLVLNSGEAPKTILQSLGETCGLVGKKVSETVSPIALNINKGISTAGQAVSESLTPVTESLNQGIQKATKSVNETVKKFI